MMNKYCLKEATSTIVSANYLRLFFLGLFSMMNFKGSAIRLMTLGRIPFEKVYQAGWAFGGVQNTYLRYEAAGDMHCGRAASRLPSMMNVSKVCLLASDR